MTRPVVRLAPALALLLAGPGLLAGCSDDEPSAAPASSSPSATTSSAVPSATASPAASPPPVPTRGTCHQLTYDQAVAPTAVDQVADCRGSHTAETFAVGQLKTLVGGHLLAVDATAVQQRVATACPQRLASYVGGTVDDLRLSMLRSVWFTPTVAESDAGANWFRCDAIAVAREDQLAPVQGRLEGVLSTQEGRDRFGMCGTAQPGSADFARVLCRAPHTWRAIRTVALDAGPYPGEGTVRDAGQQVCDDAARARASDSLDYQWGYEWPTSEQWDAGQTYGRCWAPD